MQRTAFQWLFIVIIATIAVLAPAGAARAEITFNAEIRETYEDNVLGLVSDNPNVTGTDNALTVPNQAPPVIPRIKGRRDDVLNDVTTTPGVTAPAAPAKGDFSTNIYADIGSTTDLGNNLSLLFKADVQHTSYQTVKQFDFTIGAVRAGVSSYLTDEILAKVLARVAIKNFDKNLRNSTAYGATVSLKESLTPSFWLKQVYDYEQNDANDSLFSYQGDSFSLWAGYSVTEKSSVGLGYSYLVRNFDKVPPVLKLTTQTLSVDWTWDFYDKWSLNAAYDLVKADSNLPDSASTNNVYSVGLLFSY